MESRVQRKLHARFGGGSRKTCTTVDSTRRETLRRLARRPAPTLRWFVAGFHKPGFRERYQQAVRRFGLDPSARLSELSKGGYAKVGLALALAPDPEVLILDEPTSGLDLLVRREFLASMVRLAGEGRTILISSHQISEVERVASHAAFMHEGRLLLAAPLDELRRRVVRYRLRFAERPPDAGILGTVLQRNGAGRQWQAVIRDPDPQAVETLRSAEGIDDFEEGPLSLEDLYCALLAREEHP
jgi:ABC-2 type transport system ATP-binding protein